jgi:hypothetical protein
LKNSTTKINAFETEKPTAERVLKGNPAVFAKEHRGIVNEPMIKRLLKGLAANGNGLPLPTIL